MSACAPQSYGVIQVPQGSYREGGRPSRGESNLGNYCNKALDDITDKILFEVDPKTRDRLIKEAYQIAMDDYGFIWSWS